MPFMKPLKSQKMAQVRTFSLDKAIEAYRQIDSGQLKGKAVIIFGGL